MIYRFAYLRDADPVLARLIDDRPDFDPHAWLARLPVMDLYSALASGQVLGTPTLFIDGVVYRGGYDPPALLAALAALSDGGAAAGSKAAENR